MYNKILSGILVVLLIAIIGALGYLGYGYFSKYNTEKEAERYLEEEFLIILIMEIITIHIIMAETLQIQDIIKDSKLPANWKCHQSRNNFLF